MVKVVLVIDMVRGFLEKGYPLYCGSKARGIIPNIQKLLEQELEQGAKLFYLCDHHAPDDPEFKLLSPHCIEGTLEVELIPEFSQYRGEIIPKRHFSGFYDTPLEGKLKELEPEVLVICGVCTDICVLHTVADARNRGYQVEVPVDCVASFDEEAHTFALGHMEKVLGARLIRPEVNLPKPRFEIPDSWLSGKTADIYFPRTVEILKKEAINPIATMEIFPRQAGILCGMEEGKALLKKVLPEGRCEVWALAEGEPFNRKEVVLRIKAP